MLVLSRRKNEAIRIDDEISVILLGIKGRHVKLGIQAPLHIEVHREEVYQRIYQQIGQDYCDDSVSSKPSHDDP